MKPWLILANVLLTTFLVFLSAAVTLIADSSIQGELALSAPKAQWVTTFYLLGITSIVPASTWLSIRFGQKRVYLFGTFLFTLSSALIAFAGDFPITGFARFTEGMGAGLIFPVGLAMIVRNIPKEKLPLALNLYIAVGFGLGLGFGLPLSGYFAQFLSWRDVFLLMIPLGTVAFLECWLCHPETPPNETSPFDFCGFFSFIACMASLLVALSFGALPSTDGGWTSPFILGMFALSACALVATIFIERRVANPAIPLQIFRDPVFVLCILSMFLLGMALFSSLSSSMLFMLKALKYEKFVTGLIGATYGCSMAMASILTSQLVKKVPVPLLMLSGLAILITSYFLNNQITLQSAPPQLILILLLRGLGVGLSLGPIMGLGLHSVPKELEVEATTLLTFFRQIGGTYGGIILTILMIKRTIFHAARFSEQTNAQIPGYRVTWQGLRSHFFTSINDGSTLAARKQATAAIVQNVETQAFIQGLNDGLVVFGWVTLTVALLLGGLIAKRMWSRRKPHAAE